MCCVFLEGGKVKIYSHITIKVLRKRKINSIFWKNMCRGKNLS